MLQMAFTVDGEGCTEEREGWGVHNCCCDHVVDELEAMPDVTSEQRHEATRDRYYECPHKFLTALEVYLGTQR
jgi:hypothetical protein